jgi:hypothetical protein
MGNSDFLFARPSFITGIARLFDFAGTLNSYNISPSEQIADARALHQDWKAIGDDMRAALAAYKKEQECSVNA